MKNKNILALLFAATLASCSNEPKKDTAKELNQAFQTDSSSVEVSADVINEMIQSVPSPVELSTVLLESGAEYESSLINSIDNCDKYTTDYEKALNLGVYGLDLIYMNIYEKTLSTVNYISSVKRLADNLNVGQFFDFSLLKKMSSTNNRDSLINTSTNSFLKMNSYLRENKRGAVSALIMAGSWIEGVYISGQIAMKTQNKELRDRIGEQKIALDNILIILGTYKNDPDISKLITQMESLKKEYEKVDIIHIYKAPTTKTVDGVLITEDNSTDEIRMSDETLQNITNIIKQTRTNATKQSNA